ncbi:MAG: hypothetical protein FWG14_09420 [Peptococcaceae bacterium]|nr:hypothetical protein [Peptococcaceae bacterium]
MAVVEVKDNQIVIRMQGIRRKIGTFKSEFSVPLDTVKGAAVSTEAWKNTPKPGQKEWGTDLYGWYFGGTFVQKGKRIFYDLKRNEKAVIIELKDAGDHRILTPHLKPPSDDFFKIIIGVESPDETVKIIEDALQRQE